MGAFGSDGLVGANPFVGTWDSNSGAFVGGVERISSLTDASEVAAEFVPGAWHDALSAAGGRHGVRVAAVRSASGVYGETLIDIEAEPATTLIWTGSVPIRHIELGEGDPEEIRPNRRRPLLEKVFTLEPMEVDCSGQAEPYDVQFGQPHGQSAGAGHTLVRWPARMVGPSRTLDGGALFLEYGGPVRSSATAPYLKLCGTRRPLDARVELAFQIEESAPLALLDVRCGCTDRRYVLVDLVVGETVNWSW
ncbi:MAG: hypothetical protein GY913_00125 [Proteobacteria bacterium]|nr:hypothetical protein [Pseudomonadota bacterium]MCP4915303.1 hypothetical protein [Pseudomonadota bacterium]